MNTNAYLNRMKSFIRHSVEPKMRTEFRKVRVQDKTYLYPFPVLKGNKYLIEVKDDFAEFLILSLKNQYLYSPDRDKDYLVEIGVHTDGNTPIFQIENSKLCFNFLPNAERDPKKAKALHQLISNKVISVLVNDKDARQKLKQRFESQLKCSTCKSLGIGEPKIKEWIKKL